MSGRHFDPDHDTVSRIAAAGMAAAEAQAEREGVELGDTIIALSVEGQPEGEANATVHAHMADDDRAPDAVSVLAVLCAKAQVIAEEQGIDLDMIVNGRRA